MIILQDGGFGMSSEATHICRRCKGTEAYKTVIKGKGLVVCVECDYEWVPHGYCLHCRKALQPIGSARINGAPHKDWGSRKYHKKCWKELNS